MNVINLTGNICKDIEVKQTQNGKAVTTIDLAVKRPFTKDTTDFIPLVVWEKNAEYLGRYARKGSRIAISGKLTTRKYQDKNGNNRVAFEVVCDSVEIMGGGNDAQGAEAQSGAYIPDAYKESAEPKFEPVNADDDLPF